MRNESQIWRFKEAESWKGKHGEGLEGIFRVSPRSCVSPDSSFSARWTNRPSLFFDTRSKFPGRWRHLERPSQAIEAKWTLTADQCVSLIRWISSLRSPCARALETGPEDRNRSVLFASRLGHERNLLLFDSPSPSFSIYLLDYPRVPFSFRRP